MFLKSPFIVLAAPLLLGATAAPIILSGKAQSCSGGKPAAIVGVKGINVSAFNKNKVASLVTLLRNMDTATFPDSTAMGQFIANYNQMVSLTNSSTAIARTTSGSTGAFTINTSPVDSVLVVGYANSEGQPAYYSYKMVGGRGSSSFVLDMSRGDCSR